MPDAPDNTPDATALADQIVDALVGSDESPLNVAIREQITAQVGNVVEELGMAESVAEMRREHEEMREMMASRPPVPARVQFPGAPFETAAVVALRERLGIPSPNWYNPEAEGARLDGDFNDLGDFMRAVIRRGVSGRDDPRLVMAPNTPNMAADLTGEEIELGGALVPEEFRPTLLNMQLQPTTIRGRAMVLPMAAPTITIPKIRDVSHADGNVFGGIAFNWLEVGDEIAQSEPDFGLITLTARALASSMAIPNTLIQDSFVSFLELMMRLWSEAVPWFEDKVFFRGDGVGKPQGIYNSPAKVEYQRAVADQISYADCVQMRARMLPSSQGRAFWAVNSEATPQLMQMQISEGGAPAYVPSLQDDVPDRFLGKPVIETEHASGAGNTGDLAYLDAMYYLVGDRQMLSMEASRHEKFSKNRTMLRGISRFDARSWLDSPITPANRKSNTFQQSPFVLLGSR